MATRAMSAPGSFYWISPEPAPTMFLHCSCSTGSRPGSGARAMPAHTRQSHLVSFIFILESLLPFSCFLTTSLFPCGHMRSFQRTLSAFSQKTYMVLPSCFSLCPEWTSAVLVYNRAHYLPLRYYSRRQPSRCTGSTFLCTVTPAWVLLPMPQACVATLLPSMASSTLLQWPGGAACSITESPVPWTFADITPHCRGTLRLSCVGYTEGYVLNRHFLSEASGSSLPPVLQPSKTKFRIRITPPWGLQQGY